MTIHADKTDATKNRLIETQLLTNLLKKETHNCVTLPKEKIEPSIRYFKKSKYCFSLINYNRVDPL